MLIPVQRPRHAVREDLCWQLHPEQLQLAPGAMGLVTALTSIPIEAERHLLTIPGTAQLSPTTLPETGHLLCTECCGTAQKCCRLEEHHNTCQESSNVLALSCTVCTCASWCPIDAGKEPLERGPGYISEAAHFAKGGFGEVWKATRHSSSRGNPFCESSTLSSAP